MNVTQITETFKNKYNLIIIKIVVLLNATEQNEKKELIKHNHGRAICRKTLPRRCKIDRCKMFGL